MNFPCFTFECFHLETKGLPYMLERAGLDVQQGNECGECRSLA